MFAALAANMRQLHVCLPPRIVDTARTKYLINSTYNGLPLTKKSILPTVKENIWILIRRPKRHAHTIKKLNL